MKVEQFVMAYGAEQDRLRALLPEGFMSLRPVLRINAEIRGEEGYVEFNTPVEAFGKRGWLNIGHWAAEWVRRGSAVTFYTSFLTITYTGVGIRGGCPAEQDNEGCFFPGETLLFAPAEKIRENKEFCNCEFAWSFAPGDAHGVRVGGKTLPAIPSPPERTYEKQPLTPQTAAQIPCQQILGAYRVCFER